MSDARTDALYQDTILAHYRAPHNRRALEHPDGEAYLKNTLCGDEVRMMVRLHGERVEDAAFQGQGCSICQATASMLTDVARGQTRTTVREVVGVLRAMLAGKLDAEAVERLGELRVLVNVARYPGRIRCATLPAEALELALATRES